ncbi:hypothetical protein [Arsukibacterium indicum]|uniref:Uncharacterized protein n=1 Tax=Arsukibacterium indicum TaxID=2848612 RepID=A0ABS6MJP5_9GAMM|nr:hypothetical protein [Arsukibacterium indicum]MBV2129023.1 hypothetical protein [Arsukibacterium indicum]
MVFDFNPTSGWTLEMELRCFVIFKKTEAAGFPRGMQTDLCNDLAAKSNLSAETIKAKVGNFKSEAGYTNETNASKATKYLIKNYGALSEEETEALLAGYMLSKIENA